MSTLLKGTKLAKEIRARFSKGVFEPLEDVALEEGKEVVISVQESYSAANTLRALQKTAGAWEGTHDAEELKRNIYSDRLIATRPEPKL